MVILGIDPGTSRVGYGVIRSDSVLRYVDAGLLPVKSQNAAERFAEIHRTLSGMIEKHTPHCAAIESLYFNKNKKTALEVAHARGVIVLTLTLHRIPIVEYTPPQIKRAITGSGSADKKNVLRTIEKLLKIEFESEHDDVSDALAIALTAAMDNSRKLRG